MKLTNQQKELIKRLEETEGERYFLIEGYAGTGKTTAIFKYLEQKLDQGRTVMCSSFTNKAVKVLKKIGTANGDRPGLEFATLHKALKLGVYDGLEEAAERISFDAWMRGDPIDQIDLDFDILVVDECSMLSDWLMANILAISEKTRVIFMGDPCQLFPVEPGQPAKLSSSFNTRPRYCLTEVMRQTGPLLPWVQTARQHVLTDTAINPQPGTAVRTLEIARDPATYGPLADEFKNGWYDNPDRFRVICYHRKTTQEHLAAIRSHLFTDPRDFEPGEIIICRKPISRIRKDKDKYDNTVFWKVSAYPTSEEFRILDVAPVEIGKIKGWKLSVKDMTGGSTELRAVASEDQGTYDAIYNSLWWKVKSAQREANDAWRRGDRSQYIYAADHRRECKNDLRKFECQWDHVQPAYVLGVHISQGSTFDRGAVDVWDFRDVLRRRGGGDKIPTFNRCWYTAATRFRSDFTLLKVN